MLLKVRIKLLTDRITNLLKKKKVVKPDFRHPIYAQRKAEPQKSRMELAIAFLLPFVRECGVVMWGDLVWLVNRRKPEPAHEAWNRAVERMRKGL